LEVRQAASLQISTELNQPQVEDQYNRGGFIVYNRGSMLRMIDRQLASCIVEARQAASLKISTELSQPQVEDQYNRGGFIVYNSGSIQRIIDRQLASSSDQYSVGQTGSQPPD
jgi:hypothetical protein